MIDAFETNFRADIQAEFEKLLLSKFSFLQPVGKWQQIMWHKEGNLIICLVFSAKKIKFCFFNNPNLTLDKLQRWSTTIYSQNLEISNGDKVNWEKIEELIVNTLKFRSQS